MASVREIDARAVTPRLVIELIAVAAAAGAAALFVKHEQGRSPLLKTKKQLVAATIGAAILAALALTKANSEKNEKKSAPFSVAFAILGVAACTGLFLLAKKSEARVLTSGGPDVFKAQFGLLQLGYRVQPTGQMDAATTNALKEFQATYSLLTQDGTLTPETSQYIEQAVHSSAHMVPPLNPEAGFGYHPATTLQT